MSTFATVLDQTRRELGEQTANVWSDTSFYAWAGDCLRDISFRIRRESDEQYITTTAGDESYPLPTGTLRIDDVRCNGSRLTYTTIDQFPATETSGQPLYWTVDGHVLRLTPSPDGAYDLTLYRDCLPTAPASLTDTMPFDGEYDHIIRHYMRARAYEQIADFDSANLANQMYNSSIEQATFAESSLAGGNAPVEVY